MDFNLIPFASDSIKKQAANEVIGLNGYTQKFGLSLNQKQAAEIVDTRVRALNNNGRIEFGSGVIDKIIKAFCDSPYIYMDNYSTTIQELVEIFYLYKNETMDLITDDELIDFMKSAFDGVCQGSLDLLSERELFRLADNLRLGLPYDNETGLEEEDDYE